MDRHDEANRCCLWLCKLLKSTLK